MSCYVCLEKCNEKSPCECEHLVHKECLHETCQSQHIIHCTICKSRLDNYVFRSETVSKNGEYHIIDSDSDSDSDDNIINNNRYFIQISKCKYRIFYILWWILLSSVFSVLTCVIICSVNSCTYISYSIIISIGFLLEFLIIFSCSKKNNYQDNMYLSDDLENN